MPKKVERHLVGSVEERRSSREELVSHLSEAAEAGELTEALDRLGDPKAAAASFARGQTRLTAPVGRRLDAAIIDNLPLVGVTIALLVQEILRGPPIEMWFPPDEYIEDRGLILAVGVPLTLAWSILALGIMESRTGYTPAKRLLGLRLVTDSGLRVPIWMGVVRRLSFLAGQYAWIDWILVLFTDRRQRILDYLVGTVVVEAEAGGGQRRREPQGSTH